MALSMRRFGMTITTINWLFVFHMHFSVEPWSFTDNRFFSFSLSLSDFDFPWELWLLGLIGLADYLTVCKRAADSVRMESSHIQDKLICVVRKASIQNVS